MGLPQTINKNNMERRTAKISELTNNTGQIPGVPKNPRFVKDDKFKTLVKSIQDDPEMLHLREVIAYDTGTQLVVIMGNMRLRAARECKHKEVPVKILPTNTPPEKLRAYVIKDNIQHGEHDMDLLANEWDTEELKDFGLDLGIFEPDPPQDTTIPHILTITLQSAEEAAYWEDKLNTMGLAVKSKRK